MPINPLMICGAFGLAVLVGAGARATTVLPLGTEGRVAAWVGGTCGRATAGLVQVEDGIGLSRNMLIGSPSCAWAGGVVASEAFVLPANAQNVKLRLEEFEALRGITLQLNGQIIASGGDDNDDTTMPAARFVPGKTNSLTLVLGPSGLAWQGSLLAELEASVSYDLAAAQTPPSTTSGSNVPVPEPPTALLMAIALAVLGAVAARRRA